MKYVFLDFETYYDKEYSLRKMTPAEYINDARFETIGCAAAVDDGEAQWLEGDQVEGYLHRLGTEDDLAVITHNALFDACILSYRYDIHPYLLVDTMSMARALLMHELQKGSVSLDNVAEHLSLGSKIKGTLESVSGLRLRDLKGRPELYCRYREYALRDVNLCRGIFGWLRNRFPDTELVINHHIIRMATKPQFIANTNKLHQHKSEIVLAKHALLEKCGITKEELMSNDKFAAALQRLGVEPPTKVSPTTGKTTWAFARTDAGMQALEEHDNVEVQLMIGARLGHKSTLEESRTQRFIDVAYSFTRRGNDPWLPIPLKFSGAHTHRFSGDWKLNMQNLPSRKGSKLLRESLEAPPGHVVLACDASQIEARLTAWLGKQWDLVEQFANKEDPYSKFASEIYGREITKANKTERFVGKTCILGLGFGMGAAKFHGTIRTQAYEQGITIDIDEQEAQRIVNLYRAKMHNIKSTWYYLQDRLADMMTDCEIKWGPVTFVNEAIILPSGLRLHYHGLTYDGDNREFHFTYGGKKKYIYGGKLLENIVQALDRVAVMEAALRIDQRCAAEGIPIQLAHQVHDELVYVPRLDVVDAVKPIILEEMRRPPAWGLDLPLDAEAGTGPNYGAVDK